MDTYPLLSNKRLVNVCTLWSQPPLQTTLSRARAVLADHGASLVFVGDNFLIATALVSPPCTPNLDGSLRRALSRCPVSRLIAFEIPAQWESI